MVVDVVVEVALAVAHTEALAEFDGSAAAGSEHWVGTVGFPCRTWHFHCHTAGSGAVDADAAGAGAGAAEDSQLVAASAGGH